MKTRVMSLDDFAAIRVDLLQVAFDGEATTGVTPAGMRISFTPICAVTGRGVLVELEPASYEALPGELTLRVRDMWEELARGRRLANEAA